MGGVFEGETDFVVATLPKTTILTSNKFHKRFSTMKITPLARHFPCLQCEQPISYERFRSRFCSQACESVFEQDSKTRCQTCGDWKTPPKPEKSSGQRLCFDCAKNLLDRNFCCVAGQATYLFELYNDRYESKLSTLEWEQKEMDALGYTLRSFIKKSLKEKHQIEARLSWLSFRKENHTCEERAWGFWAYSTT